MAEEIPIGTVDGVNATFTLAESPTKEMLFVDRVLQVPSVDYTLTGGTIVFQSGAIPPAGAILRIYFGDGT